MSDGSSRFQRLLSRLTPKTSSKKSSPKFGSPVRVVATILALFIISQIFAAVVVGAGLSILHPGAGVDKLLTESAAAQFFYVLIAEGLAVGSLYLILKRRRLNFTAIGFGRWPEWRDLKSALLGFGAYYALLIVILVFASWLIPSLNVDQTQDVGFNTLNSSLDKLIAFTALVILAPVGEEILMRGYLYTGLRASWNFIPALLVTSLLFGLAHLEFGNEAPLVWVAAISTFTLSVVLIYMREKTAALYASILIHMLNNGVAFAIHFL